MCGKFQWFSVQRCFYLSPVVRVGHAVLQILDDGDVFVGRPGGRVDDEVVQLTPGDRGDQRHVCKVAKLHMWKVTVREK